jgi:hypothetical protein
MRTAGITLRVAVLHLGLNWGGQARPLQMQPDYLSNSEHEESQD